MAAVVEGMLQGYISVRNKIFYFTHEMKMGLQVFLELLERQRPGPLSVLVDVQKIRLLTLHPFPPSISVLSRYRMYYTCILVNKTVFVL